MMMMMMISSSSTFVDVHTDARRSRRSKRSSSRRASFVHRPSSPTTAGMHARTHPSRPRSVAARARERRAAEKKGCARTLIRWAESYPSALQPAYVSFVPTHTPYCTSVCPIVVQVVQKKQKHSRRAHRPDPTTRAMMDDGCRRRPRERDARTTRRGDERRGERETDHVGRVTVRVTVHA